MMTIILEVWTVMMLITAVYSHEMIVTYTRLGKIKGIKQQYKDSTDFLYEFRGVRYAKPPVGEFRFQKPVPTEKWTETYDATSFGPACPQGPVQTKAPSLQMSEDCLFLNIYVPKSIRKSDKLSVMVWIHGGEFRMGTSHNYDGSRIAMEGDVIVVTLNYRLGIFGFLSLFHPAARGNYGLWDQKLALQWVHDNIENFGGDPKSVTIFGQSAGGVSVSFQSLTSSNRGLFQRSIAQSGVLSRFSILRKETVTRRLSELATQTGCLPDDPHKFVECLRGKTFEELIEQSSEGELVTDGQVMLETLFYPCIDGELFPEHPLKLLRDPKSPAARFFGRLDFIAGTTSQEGSILYEMISEQTQKFYDFDLKEGIPTKFVCDGLIQQIVDLHYGGKLAVKDILCKYYSAESAQEQSMKAVGCVADYFFTEALAEVLDTHAGWGSGMTYQYQFSVQSPNPASNRPTWFSGAGHGDELIYLSILPGDDSSFTEKDREVSRRMIQYWTSFAKTGKPFAGRESQVWLTYDTNGRICLDIGSKFSLRSYLKRETVEFWNLNIPPVNLDNDDNDDDDDNDDNNNDDSNFSGVDSKREEL